MSAEPGTRLIHAPSAGCGLLAAAALGIRELLVGMSALEFWGGGFLDSTAGGEKVL